MGGLVPGLAQAPSPGGTPPERTRPYAVLRGQNLVLMGSIFSILLVTMILMAICVYKPLRRR
uniref:Chromosome 12 open reading frame 76 n=1 Tax=Sarcophilus harrisii TaxID=9305 RepID=A0A7N4V0F5_SARHA